MSAGRDTDDIRCSPFSTTSWTVYCNREDLSKLSYTVCIKESLRLYPSIPFGGKLLTNNSEMDGRRIPKGMNVV